MAEPAAARPFLGWRVVFAGFVAQLVANALTFSATGVFVTPLEQEFGTDRATISNAFGIAFLVMGVLGALLGRWIDRGPIAAIMIAGVTIASAGIWLGSRAQELWQLGLVFCLVVTTGTVLYGPLPSIALVGRWFVRRRGLAVGVAVAGATVGSALAPATAAWLIEWVGWRAAMAIFAVTAFAVAVPVFYFCALRSPEHLGQRADGAPEPMLHGEPEARSYTARDLLRDPNFWWIAVGMALVFTSPIVTMLHLVPYAESQGVSRQDASYVLSLLALFSLIGKIAFGAVSDRIDPRHALWLMVALLAGGWALLTAGPSYAGLLAIGALFGLGIGAAAPIHAVLVGSCFGRGAFGQVMGLGGLISLPLIAGANPVAGALYVRTGDYRAGFLLEVALLALAALLFAFLRQPRRRPAAPAAAAAEQSPAPAG